MPISPPNKENLNCRSLHTSQNQLVMLITINVSTQNLMIVKAKENLSTSIVSKDSLTTTWASRGQCRHSNFTLIHWQKILWAFMPHYEGEKNVGNL